MTQQQDDTESIDSNKTRIEWSEWTGTVIMGGLVAISIVSIIGGVAYVTSHKMNKSKK